MHRVGADARSIARGPIPGADSSLASANGSRLAAGRLLVSAPAKTMVDPRRWRRIGPKGLSLWEPSSLSDDDVRELWRFRLRFMDLKPSVDPEEDYASFADFVRRADVAWVLLDGAAIAAISFYRNEVIEHAGRRYHVLFGEYGFAALRGDPRMVLAILWLFVQPLVRGRGRAVYYFGFAYPHSYLSLARASSHVWLLGDEAMPTRERAIADALGRRLGGERWDPVRRRYDFPTLPREAVPRASAPHRARLLAHYERLNPEWREGQGLLLLNRLDAGTIPHALRAALRRIGGHRRRPAA